MVAGFSVAVDVAVDGMENRFVAERAGEILKARLADVDATVRLRVGPVAGMKHDGYEVVREGSAYTVTASRPRALLYVAGEPEVWLGRDRTRRDPAFRVRMANWTKSTHSAAEWIAATGANVIHAGRGGTVTLEKSMPEVFAALKEDERNALVQRRERNMRTACEMVAMNKALDVPTYPLLYGCDAMKWNTQLTTAFLAVHPEAKGVDPGRSWEKGVLCPSAKATWDYIRAYVAEFASSTPCEGIVATFWDDYGINCHCRQCRKGGMDRFPGQIAKLVKTYEEALKPLGKKLIVRTWASGAPHFLGEEWVNAPGYAGREDAVATWGRAIAGSDPGTVIQTKVYNSDCQPDPPFSNLLGEARRAGRTELAEWQITGQTVGLQWLPASVCGHTAWTMKRAFELVGPEGGVCIYTGGYKNGGYEALDDVCNSINLKMWRQLSWNPDDDAEAVWEAWARPIYGKAASAAIAALKATERAAVASFSPLGFGAPTESGFAGSVARREDLLRYTNRHYLPEYRDLLLPTKENTEKVVAEKDAAIASVDAAVAGLEGAQGEAVSELRTRLGWLRTHLVVSRALDEALWRSRRIRYLSDIQRADVEELAAVERCRDVVKSEGGRLFEHSSDAKMSFYPDPLGERAISLGSPGRLMSDILEICRAKTEKVVGPRRD